MKKFKLFLFAAVLLSGIGLHAGNTITYTASEKLPGYYGSLEIGATTFGSAITSHEFSNGTGTIICNGEITKIGKKAFMMNDNLRSITIPNSVSTIEEQAFRRCSGLTSIDIPNSVTTIGDYAFYECSALTSINISNSVTSIGNDAFSWCSCLTSITIPNSVKAIGNDAFYYVNNIVYSGTATGAPWGAKCVNGYIDEYFVYSDAIKTTLCGCSTAATGSISIPKSVTTIGKSAFYDCSNITSVAIPNTVTTIGEYAFFGCTGLTEVTVGWFDEKSIVPINENMFGGMANGVGPVGATLYVPQGTADLYRQANGWKDFGHIIDPNECKITYTASAQLSGEQFNTGATTFGSAIVSHTFSNGTGTITCEGEITTIGEKAFYECKNLTLVTIPNTVTTIGEKAFYVCSGLTSITIPASVTSIGETAFEGSSTGLTSIVVAGGNPQYDSRDNCNAIVETATNTLILGCKNTKVPNNITTIGRSAFDGCYDLKDITIPNSVTTIGRSAFWECKNLTSITIPNAVTTIGMNAFKGTGLTSITLPASVKEINEHAFWGCTGLTSVTVSWTDAQSIPSINSNVFEGIANGAGPSGATLHMPEGTDNLYKQADVWKDFGNIIDPNCKITYTASEKLLRNELKEGATTFGPAITNHDFSNGIGTITCSGEITEIGKDAFYDCISLTSITIPNSVTTIGNYAFHGAGLTSITIPNSVTTIGQQAFYECKNLTSVTIPNSVTTIGVYAFRSCSGLTSITIPNSVTTIGDWAFSNCTGLTSVTVSWTDAQSIVSIKSNVFVNIANGAGLASATLYVPVGTVNLYNQADVWKDFGSKVEIIPITYTAPAQLTGNQFNVGATTFGPAITSHTFSNGKGTITCSGEITTIGQAAFSRCGLTSITIPNSVTQIGAWAFEYCSNLQNINLPSSIKSIDVGTFQWAGLTSIIIPASVGRIEDFAFWACPLEYVACMSETPPALGNKATFPDAKKALVYVPTSDAVAAYKNSDWSKYFTNIIIKTITYYASEKLPGYEGSLDVGSTTFGPAIIGHTFSNGVGTIACAGEITQIGEKAFYECKNLTSVTIPNSVTTIGDWAFYYCSGLTSVTIPNSVTTIGDWAFYYCIGLTEVTVSWTDEKSIPSINSNVFQKIAYGAGLALATLHVQAGTVNLYNQANVWKDFSHIIDPAACTISYTASEKLSGYNGSLNVGSTTFGPAITSHEFSNGTGTITCDGAITKISALAFVACGSLTSITLPKTITTIDKQAFEDCWALTSIEIPNSVVTIWERAFYNSGLRSATIGSSVSHLGSETFYYCRNLKTIYCCASRPPSLGRNDFHGVPEDLSVYVYDVEVYKRGWTTKSDWEKFPESCFKQMFTEVDGIRYELFVGNKAKVVAKEGGYTQSTITFPEQITFADMAFTVTEIDQSAFKNCTGLTSVIIPKSVTTIGMDAFWQCSNLSSVTIPNSVTTIGQSAFFETGLTSVTIPASVKEIGTWAFKNCTQLKDLQFADRTDAINIGAYAFENMALTEVIIPDWMTDIPEGLFYNNTKLTAIYLPEQVNTIGHRPFGACPLEYIISMSETPPALPVGEAFEGYNKDASVIVYVPSMDAVVAYQKSDWNKYFTNFITNNTYRILSASSGTAELVSVIPDEKEKTISIPSVIAIDGDYYRVIGIGDEAFKDNTVLQSISLPPTIQYIGNSAFSGCTQLKQTNSRFWEDLQTIGDAAFYGCSALDSIVIPEGVQSIGNGAFKECRSLKYVSLPTGLKNIPNECFRFCYLVGEIIIPEGVETIGQSAFEGTAEIVSKELVISLPSTLREINYGAFFWHNWLKGVTCLATTPPTLTGQAFVEYQYQEHKDEPITVYVPNRDVLPAYRDDTTQWGSNIYKFKFSDLMAEENKQYLNTVAGNNDEAQAIASAYCDSIDNYANNSEDVQQYTNTALGKIDKLTLEDYKKQLIDSLKKTAGENIEAQQIVEQYKTQIENAYFRQDAEQLFKEAEGKINGIFELIALKNNYILELNKQTIGDPDLQQVAKDYSNLIQLAETKEEVEALYLMAELRIARNKQIKEDWKCSTTVNKKTCSTTEGYK